MTEQTFGISFFVPYHVCFRLKITQRIFALTVKKSTPEFVRKRFYDLLEEFSELCNNLGKPFQGDIDAVSDGGDEALENEEAGEEEEEEEEEEVATRPTRPPQGRKGRAVESGSQKAKSREGETKKRKDGRGVSPDRRPKGKRVRILEAEEEAEEAEDCRAPPGRKKGASVRRPAAVTEAEAARAREASGGGKGAKLQPRALAVGGDSD